MGGLLCSVMSKEYNVMAYKLFLRIFVYFFFFFFFLVKRGVFARVSELRRYRNNRYY